MGSANLATLLELTLGALDKASKAGNLLRQCQAEGRNPTEEELQLFFEDDDAARGRLQDAIDAARGGAPVAPT